MELVIVVKSSGKILSPLQFNKSEHIVRKVKSKKSKPEYFVNSKNVNTLIGVDNGTLQIWEVVNQTKNS